MVSLPKVVPVGSATRDAATGDIGLSWIRSSRADTGSWATSEVPLNDAPEAYVVSILDGAMAVRTIESGGPVATYAAADQTADFAGLPGSFGFAVAQVSPLFGPGHVAVGAFDA